MKNVRRLVVVLGVVVYIQVFRVLWAGEFWVQFLLPPKFFGEPATLKFVCCQCIMNDINYLSCTARLKRHSIGTEKVVGQRKKFGEKKKC